jgi:hypothetical protein
MGKILVKARPSLFYTPGAGANYQINLNEDVDDSMPLVGVRNAPVPGGSSATPTSLLSARDNARVQAEMRRAMDDPRIYIDPEERRQQEAIIADMENQIDSGQPRSYEEKFMMDAAERMRDKFGGKRFDVNPADLDRAGQLGAKAGILGRQFGGGLAGMLAAYKFLTGLEQGGATGQGLDNALGTSALGAMGTYQTIANPLRNVGGEAGSRLGTVGVRPTNPMRPTQPPTLPSTVPEALPLDTDAREALPIDAPAPPTPKDTAEGFDMIDPFGLKVRQSRLPGMGEPETKPAEPTAEEKSSFDLKDGMSIEDMVAAIRGNTPEQSMADNSSSTVEPETPLDDTQPPMTRQDIERLVGVFRNENRNKTEEE